MLDHDIDIAVAASAQADLSMRTSSSAPHMNAVLDSSKLRLLASSAV